MISDIAGAVESELGESMPEPAWQAIARMWSTKSLGKGAPREQQPVPRRHQVQNLPETTQMLPQGQSRPSPGNTGTWGSK